MSEHTRDWFIGEGFVNGARHYAIGYDRRELPKGEGPGVRYKTICEFSPHPEAKRRAEFVLAACNSHDAMRVTLDWIKKFCRANRTLSADNIAEIASRAALALAEKGTNG